MRKLLGISNSDTGGGVKNGAKAYGGAPPAHPLLAGNQPGSVLKCVCTCAYVTMCVCASGRTKVSQPRERRVTVAIRKLGWGQSQEHEEGSAPGRSRTLTE